MGAVAEIINLNRHRKAKAKEAAAIKAQNNRVKFGRPRSVTDSERKIAAKNQAELDGKKLED